MSRRDRTPIVHSPGVLAIPLTRGLFALIDEADAPMVAPYRWYAIRGARTHYAVRKIGPVDNRQNVYMHRVILSAAADQQADHRNGEGTDNRRANLRLATASQNRHNRVHPTKHSSRFTGVTWDAARQRWMAAAIKDGKRKFLGRFEDEVEAAKAYDAFVIANRGEFASPNFPHGTLTS